MEQSNLVELARRGEPDAIAMLMNAVLGPKGITARASLERNCLNVLLESPKSLNRDTITSFIQKGLLELEILSIHKVRASGKKLTDERIAWTKEFSIAPRFSERVFSFVQDDFPVPVIEPAPRDEEEAPTPLEPEPPIPVAEPEDFPELSLPEHLILDDMPPAIEEEIEIPEHFLLSEEEELKLELGFEPDSSVALQEKVEEEIEEEEDNEAFEEELPLSRLHLVGFYSRAYALPIVLVGVGSFFAGGTAAFFTTSQAKTNEVNQVLEAQNQTPEVKQAEAEKYIKAMNAAQEKFYKDNNRFANSLEELERSASLISQSYSYAYRLKVSDRSVISAFPREAGLKSYSGAVFVAQSGTTALICQTKKPSMEAPITPEFSNGKASCDPRSAKLPI